jgi:hypothetical protein
MKTVKKILKVLNVLTAYTVMFIFMWGAWQTLPACAQTTSTVTPDLSGRWGVTYEGGSERPGVHITLFVSTATAEHPMDELSGIYKDDTGSICPVKGGAFGNVFNLTVVCSKDQIEFNGTIQPDGNIITGTYKMGMESGRTFKMEKISCWLPEGCKTTSLRPQDVSIRPQWAKGFKAGFVVGLTSLSIRY